MTRWILAAIFITVVTTGARADELYVASYNVENLFDTYDDPDVELDEDFTPTSPKQWTQARLTQKVKNLAGVIKKMNDAKGPDILGLCEIENLEVVKLLVKEIAQNGRKYQIIHMDSPSNRGIDCAIVYDADRVVLVASEFLAVPKSDTGLFETRKTRLIMEGLFEAQGKRLTVFMNHWPSRGSDSDGQQRMVAAKTLRTRLNQLLQADPLADVLTMGDFNDLPGDPSIKTHLNATDIESAATGMTLFNTAASIAASTTRGTYVFNNKWETIDQIMVSPGLLNPTGFRWKAGSTTEIRFPEQIFVSSDPQNIPRPNRSYTGNNFHPNGISDHLPIACKLEF